MFHSEKSREPIIAIALRRKSDLPVANENPDMYARIVDSHLRFSRTVGAQFSEAISCICLGNICPLFSARSKCTQLNDLAGPRAVLSIIPADQDSEFAAFPAVRLHQLAKSVTLTI